MFVSSNGLNNFGYSFNGKEKDPETVATSGSTQDYGARIYNPSLGRWLSCDPRAGKYPSLSPYSFAANSPIIALDPDGKDVIFLIAIADKDATANNSMFVKAAETRKYDIEHSNGFDSRKDQVVILQVQDLADIQGMVYEKVEQLAPKFGKTREVGVYSHNGVYDGPMGVEATSNDYARDSHQMSPEGWGEVNWNWKEGDDKEIVFYGCNSALDDGQKNNFARKMSNLPSMKNVNVAGQTNTAYPSLYTDERVYTPDFEGTKHDFSKVFKLYMVASDGGIFDFIFNNTYPLKVYKNGEVVGEKEVEGRKSDDTQANK